MKRLVGFFVVFCCLGVAVLAQASPKEMLEGLPKKIGGFKFGYVHKGYRNSAVAYYGFGGIDLHIEINDVLRSGAGDNFAGQLVKFKDERMSYAAEAGLSVLYDGEKKLVLDSGKKVKVLYAQLGPPGTSLVMMDLYVTVVDGYLCMIGFTRDGKLAGKKDGLLRETVRETLSCLLK